MSLHHHFQEVIKAEPLPHSEDIGMCLNCSFWEVEGQTHLEEKEELAPCIYPDFIPLALIVSGTSACNKWKERDEVDPAAKAYSKIGEEKH